jgi:hypothetical protein
VKSSPRPRQRGALLFGALAVPLVSLGCEPPLVVGALTCSSSETGVAGANDGGAVDGGKLPAPWQSSFDDGFCGYNDSAGYCYADSGGAYRIVTSPVHSGAFAAAFDLRATGGPGTRQARCVRQGVLPEQAFYGAWYYVPSGSSDPVNWNLFHFQGGERGRLLHGLWDVSLDALPDGQMAAYVRDLLHGHVYEQAEPIPVPNDTWFHLEFYYKRASDETGEVALYQDDVEVVRVTDVVTDDDTPFGQWYVGNLALALTPPTSSVYVDDVSVRLNP